jgi:bifunctional enzyme CysN/CysC
VETDSVPIDTVEAARTVRRTGSTVKVGSIDFSLLTDGLEAERDQGITIDVAYRSMNLVNGRRLIIADAPGHEQYTRNMAVAASRADIALVLIDVTRGIRTQTLRHLTICSIMGINKIIVAINKMDRVDYNEASFQEIADGLQDAISRLNIETIYFVPISALAGDNVSNSSGNMTWYRGPTLLERIQEWEFTGIKGTKPRLNVQMISRAEDFRGLAGTVVGGSFSVGDEVIVLPSKTQSKISQIATFDGDISTAEDGMAITLVLKPDVDAARGDVVELASEASVPADRFAATVVWLSESNLVHSKSYFLMSGSTQVTAIVTRVKHVINVTNGEQNSGTLLKTNEIGVIELATDSLIPLTTYNQNRFTGNFILVDRVTMNTIGAGLVTHTLRRSAAYPSPQSEVDGSARASQKNQRAKVLWFTGLSGSGKSTIANALDRELFSRGMHTYVLDGDNLRLGLNKDLGFTREDRAESVRRASEVARNFYDAGLITLVTLVSPFAEDRDQARDLFPGTDFIEVWVNTPIDVCEQRDPKGLYKKSRSGDIPNFTGRGQVYEPPTKPDLILDGTKDLKDNLEILLGELLGS